jgi:predicted lipid-binding transport protein (Tim44 family)
MYLVVITWLYVTLMMAVAEATSSTGTLLGAVFTFVLYGLLPAGIVAYILGTPGRKRAILARQQAQQAAYDAEQAAQVAQQEPAGNSPDAGATPGTAPAVSAAPDASSHAAAATEIPLVAPVRKEP